MKTYVFCILTQWNSEIFEGVQAANVADARKMVEAMHPGASIISYEYSY